ncbi:11932_t:CDS:2, partial [Dentiscutata erythropus]
NLQNVANHTKNHMTTLTAWFQENMENPIAPTMIGRLYMVQPSEGERYYLQTLLSHVK